MLISEIFYSIQGEGELAGIPSVFVRTSGCNLRCNWCDTMYASWRPEGEELSVREILRQVEAHPTRHCVLTGGEPMVAKGIHELAAALHASGRHVTIESAGTVAPDDITCDLASLSPKLKNSLPDERLPESWRLRHEALRWQPDVVRQWLAQYPYQLKFVVVSDSDLMEIQSILSQLGEKIPAGKVLLMPEGTSPDTLRERAQWLVEICKRENYRYCSRLHVELFGNQRGT